MELNCVLFIPVSSPSGIGEYMRSMIIAKAIKRCWPNVEIHFILNEQVTYLKGCPYTVHTCQGSPTKCVSRVNEIIKGVSPDLVVFDASGRAKQFKQAKEVGAKVAFISQHNKKRGRGLKLNRLLNTDIHWVAQPDDCMQSLSYWQRIKLALFNKRVPQNIGPVFELSDQEYQLALLKRYDLTENKYFIFNAGSGGHKITGKLAADIYYQAAKIFNQKIVNNKIQMKCIVVFGNNYPKEIPKGNDIICIKDIDNKAFISLLVNAKGRVLSAGDTLLQSIALHKVCVAAAVSPDQPERLNICQNKQLAFSAEATPESLALKALLMLNEEVCEKMITNINQQAPVKALEIIIEDIASLFSEVEENNIEECFIKEDT